MRMERPRTTTAWAVDGKERKAFEDRSHRGSVSRRRAAGSKRNKKHKFVGSFASDRA